MDTPKQRQDQMTVLSAAIMNTINQAGVKDTSAIIASLGAVLGAVAMVDGREEACLEAATSVARRIISLSERPDAV